MKQKGAYIHWASLTIFSEVSWIPNPIREAFLLNSDLDEPGGEVLNGTETFSARSTGVIPPIFFRVSESDRNSDVRSRYVEAIRIFLFKETEASDGI